MSDRPSKSVRDQQIRPGLEWARSLSARLGEDLPSELRSQVSPAELEAVDEFEALKWRIWELEGRAEREKQQNFARISSLEDELWGCQLMWLFAAFAVMGFWPYQDDPPVIVPPLMLADLLAIGWMFWTNANRRDAYGRRR